MVDQPEDIGKGRHFKMSLSKQSRDFSLEIENFELWPLNARKRTPNFSPEPDLTFYATLQTKKAKTGSNLNCHLTFYFTDGNDICINHIAVVTDSCGNVLYNFIPKSHTYQRRDGFELDPCPLDKLLKNSEDPVIIFKWTMEFVRFTKIVPWKPPLKAASVNVLNLANELKEMFIEVQNADTILKVGHVDVPVHKCILSKRSPVFAKMFEANRMEYDIPDLQLSVLQGLVEFLYSANLHNNNFDSVHDLYHAADLFKVDDLKTSCVSVLLSKLDVENGCKILVLAHDHQDNNFKTAVMDFILFHFNEIVKTTAWKHFVKEQTFLAAEVIETHTRNYH